MAMALQERGLPSINLNDNVLLLCVLIRKPLNQKIQGLF